MDIMEKLKSHECWLEFLEYRMSRMNMSKKETDDLRSFVENREYLPCIEKIEQGIPFSTPRLIEVSKRGTGKKRNVFSFERDENYVLKMIFFLLKEYDHLFSENLYSFRNDTGAKKAVNRILEGTFTGKAYTYKADIHDYFNSINTDVILDILEEKMPEEKGLRSFFESLFSDPFAVKDDEKIELKKGVMAGTATAGFFANLYLADLDRYFEDNNVLYARYSDDIIVISSDPENIREYEMIIKDFLRGKGLEINPEKEIRTVPGERMEFLGFELTDGEVNISDVAERKIKDKIRRKARAIYRWKLRKNAEDKWAARAFIKYLNRKFYLNTLKDDLTWCRWYFPLLTTDSKLKSIDDYAVSCIRYLYTGKHGKKNFNLRYSDIQAMGYRSLVNNFWKYKEGRYEAEGNSGMASKGKGARTRFP